MDLGLFFVLLAEHQFGPAIHEQLMLAHLGREFIRGVFAHVFVSPGPKG